MKRGWLMVGGEGSVSWCWAANNAQYLFEIPSGGAEALIVALAVWSGVGVVLALSVAPFPFSFNRYDAKFGPVHEDELLVAREQVREMFYFGYNNYMNHAYPLDELDPVHCRGRGHDHADPSNLNINDALGDYSLTLIDSLTTLVTMGDRREFHRAVRIVIDDVSSFERNTTVQVFEATIRVMGALLSAHLVLTNENPHHGDFRMPHYDGELLSMAHDLATRLLPAFEGTRTGLPYPRVNLMHGVLPSTLNETCTAGAGSLLLEFGVLSRLLGDATYESMVRRGNEFLWGRRHRLTGLLGNTIDVQTGEWRGQMSGLGAGLDSFYEYLLKAYILFGEQRDLDHFLDIYQRVETSLRRGRPKCRYGDGDPPLYANVNMRDGTIVNTWVDSLQASFAGVQVLAGDLDGAICSHAFYYALWQKYEMLPELYNWHAKQPDVYFYPLRPEFVESTYLLYMATRSPFYQRVGMQIIDSLNLHTRVNCGFATVHNVIDKSLEDRMESFFLSETTKYLYLLFDVKNPANVNYSRLLYSTEGHPFPVSERLRTTSTPSSWWPSWSSSSGSVEQQPTSSNNESCETPWPEDRLRAPLSEDRLRKYYTLVDYQEEW